MMNSSNTAGYQEVNEITNLYENIPQYKKYEFTLHLIRPKTFTIDFRIPDWIMSEAVILLNDTIYDKTADSSKFYKVNREWREGDRVSIILPIGIRFITLPDEKNLGAFRYGPEALAGICDNERILYVEKEDPAAEITMENEREWGSWRYFFKTVNQNPAISLRRIRDIGYEPFQVYFKIKRRKEN